MNIRHKIAISITASLFFVSQLAHAQWNIPEDSKTLKAPKPVSAESVIAGKALYNTNCASCHGQPGENNAIALSPKPTDLGSSEFQARSTEGSVYFQVSEGMGTMPSFKTSLKDDERWQLAQYIRSFSAEGAVDLSSQSKDLDLRLDLTSKEHKIIAVAYDKGASVEGVKVAFFIKRYFGNLPIGVSKTNANGFAQAQFPTDIPGADTLGTTEVIVKFAEEDLYGKKIITEKVAWGKPFKFINPLDDNHLWASRANTPTWLLLSYLGVVGGVWLTILWVVGQILKIRTYGKWH